MHKLTLLTGAAIGYVLGAKAGRQRYEDIKRLSRKVQDNPKVQGVAGLAQAQAEQVIHTVKAKVSGEPEPTPLPVRPVPPRPGVLPEVPTDPM